MAKKPAKKPARKPVAPEAAEASASDTKQSPEPPAPLTRDGMLAQATSLAMALVGSLSELTGDDPFADEADCLETAKQIAATPGASPADLHSRWVSSRANEGWCCGSSFAADRLEDPRMVPFRDLSVSQQSQSQIFHATIRGLLAVFDSKA